MKKYFPILEHINIANITTSASIVVSVYSLFLVLRHHLKLGLTLYALTFMLDKLDGVLARKFQVGSDFGRELDSLADAVNFCVIPALMAYVLGVDSAAALVVLMFYILAGVWRLAHYNLTGLAEEEGQQYFSGLPTTNAACWFVIVLALHRAVLPIDLHYTMLPLFLGLAVLMIHPFKYAKNRYAGFWENSLSYVYYCSKSNGRFNYANKQTRYIDLAGHQRVQHL